MKDIDIKKFMAQRTSLSMEKCNFLFKIFIEAIEEGLTYRDGVMINDFGLIVKQDMVCKTKSLTPELSRAIMDKKLNYHEAKALGIPKNIEYKKMAFIAHRKLKDKIKQIDKTTDL